jgi:riboflavin synthase
MFTGLVEETGRIRGFRPEAEAWELAVEAPLLAADTSLGESVAVNGCCLTMVRRDGDRVHFDVLEETRRLTSFSSLEPGALVNLERSMTYGGRMGGHFVTGHIDAKGRIEAFEPRGKDHYLRIRVPGAFARYLVRKGSIAVDGISLTVAEAEEESFAVWIIPHTLAVTNLQERRVNDEVNLEFDLLGKHVERLMEFPVAR